MQIYPAGMGVIDQSDQSNKARCVAAPEALAVAVCYALAVGKGVYREIRLCDLAAVLRRLVIFSDIGMFIIANAGLFAFLIHTLWRVRDAIGRWLEAALRAHCTLGGVYRILRTRRAGAA